MRFVEDYLVYKCRKPDNVYYALLEFLSSYCY